MARGAGLSARGAGVAWRLAAALALVAALLAGLAVSPAPAAAATTLTFTYTGDVQTWVVPAGLHEATFTVYGAAGGALQTNDGAPGGSARVLLAVTPGTTVWIYVGGRGGAFWGCGGDPGGGGFNGGGAGGGGTCVAAGGGGASDVRLGGDSLAQRALVAGGGGGGANLTGPCGSASGGAGGGLVGDAGSNASCGANAPGGNQDGTAGSGQLGAGGTGAARDPSSPPPPAAGGGGGGGYYGGAGGGQQTGGGGGSGFGPAGTVFQTGVRQGDGLVTVEFPQDLTALSAVRGSATYSTTTGSVTARLTGPGGVPVAGALVSFTVGGTPVGSATTNARGVATLGGITFPTGLNAGTYASVVVCASFAGNSAYLGTGPTCGPLVVGRKVLWVKAQDRTVGLRQANPPTTPPAGCVQQQTATSACWLELTNGSAFVNGDDWGDLNLAALRFSYNRNPPYTNATEYVGKTYRVTAFGAASGNYDIRYQQGTLTVVAAP